MIKSLL